VLNAIGMCVACFAGWMAVHPEKDEVRTSQQGSQRTKTGRGGARRLKASPGRSVEGGEGLHESSRGEKNARVGELKMEEGHRQ
jgi:hypothetical protein